MVVIKADADRRGACARCRHRAGRRRCRIWQRIVEDGRPAVLFNIYEQPDGNAVQVAREVQAKLAGLKLPPGTRLVNWYDQSELVTESVASVRDAVLIGLVLAALVLLLFLRNWRITLVAVIVVPATLAATVLVLMVLGMSFNIMTLGGIAAAVGLLIDDVIVMVEHIVRRAAAPAGGRGEDERRRRDVEEARGRAAVLPAAREFMKPLTGSSLATLIVFLPLSFLSGVTGAFSKALSVTMAAALIISWAMTAFVVPVLARRLVDFDKVRDPGAAGEGRLARVHDRGVDAVLARPWLLILAAVPLLVIGYIGYGHVQTGFMPKVDEGGFVMDYYTRPGTSLDESGRQIGQVDAMLRADPDVLTFSRRLGTGLGGDLGQSYHGDYFVRLKADHSRPTEEVAAAIADRVAREVPGVQVETAQLMEDLIGDLTAVPQPIEVKLYASDPSILYPQATKVAKLIGGIDGVVEVKDGVQLAGDAIDVRIDPIRAGFQGVTPGDVQTALDGSLTGMVATSLPHTAKSVDVRVRLPDMTTLTREQLAQLPIRAADGHVLPLSRVADLVPVTGQPQISRENLEPMVAVTGRIQGRGIGAAVGDVKAALDKPGVLAPGVRYELGGLYQQQQIAFAGLAKVFVAALVAEFVLLLVLYRRFSLPFVIIGCSLLSTTAVFTALWLTGVDLNITALMGMTMIIGIGTEMAIFYVSEFEELACEMPVAEAAREASRNRLRPITMTTLAAILTLLPLALAIGGGLGHPAAARDRHHRRPAAPVSAGARRDAGAGQARRRGRSRGSPGGGAGLMAAAVAGWIVALISAAGYAGVVLLMAVESACVPLPSEIVMPFAGYLASTGRFDLWLAATAGAAGCNLGSVAPFELGRRGGRAGIRRYGRWLLLTEGDVDRAERFFRRFGTAAVLVGRLLPGVRSFIALPAGLARMPRLGFHLYTFAGSWPWCFGLAYVGEVLGARWRSDERIATAFRHADLAVVVLCAAAASWFVRSRPRSGAK